MSLKAQLNLLENALIRTFYRCKRRVDTLYRFNVKLEKKKGRGIPIAGPKPSVIVTKVGKLAHQTKRNEITEIETHGQRSTTRRFGSKASLINLLKISWVQTPDATILEFLYHWTQAFHLTPLLNSTISTTIQNTLEPSSKQFLDKILTSSLSGKPCLKEWSEESRPQLFNLLAAGSPAILGEFFHTILVTIHQQFNQLNVVHGVNPHITLPQLSQYHPNHNYLISELKAIQKLSILKQVNPAMCATESQYQTGLGYHVLSSLTDLTNTAAKQQIEASFIQYHPVDSRCVPSIEKIKTLIQDLKQQRKRIQLLKNEMKSKHRHQSLKRIQLFFDRKLLIDQRCGLYSVTCMPKRRFLNSIIRNQDNYFTPQDINKAKDLLQNIQNTEIQQYLINPKSIKSIKSIRTYQCVNGVRELFQKNKLLEEPVQELFKKVKVSISNAHKTRDQQRKDKIQPWADNYLHNHQYTIPEINTIGKITVLEQIYHACKNIRTKHFSRQSDVHLSKTSAKPTLDLD